MAMDPNNSRQDETNREPHNPGTPNPALRIDRMAPAGSENSLGAESVRDGRPSTQDDVVEAKDEMGPGVDTQPASEKGGS